MRISPSYLIGDGGFLLGPTAIAAVSDLDDTSLHTCQQELGLRRSEITYDNKIGGKNFDDERCHDPHINRNQITVRKVGYEKREISSPCRMLVHRLQQRDRLSVPICGRGGGIEQCSISQPRDEMHSYRPSTQALLHMLLLLLLPSHAMS